MAKKINKCFRCGKPIDELNHNYIRLTSFYQGDIIEDVYFHLRHDGDCWGKFNDEKVQGRLTEMSKVGFGILKNMGVQV